MDLGSREQEPSVQPKPYSGLDDIYHREYVYSEDGSFSGVRLRQFFQIGKGRFVSSEQLRALWTVEFTAAGELDPALLVPTKPGHGRLEAKVKLTAAHETTQRLTAGQKRSYRVQKQADEVLAAIAAEIKRQQTRTRLPTFSCKFSGCRQSCPVHLTGSHPPRPDPLNPLVPLAYAGSARSCKLGGGTRIASHVNGTRSRE